MPRSGKGCASQRVGWGPSLQQFLDTEQDDCGDRHGGALHGGVPHPPSTTGGVVNAGLPCTPPEGSCRGGLPAPQPPSAPNPQEAVHRKHLIAVYLLQPGAGNAMLDRGRAAWGTSRGSCTEGAVVAKTACPGRLGVGHDARFGNRAQQLPQLLSPGRSPGVCKAGDPRDTGSGRAEGIGEQHWRANGMALRVLWWPL